MWCGMVGTVGVVWNGGPVSVVWNGGHSECGVEWCNQTKYQHIYLAAC